MLERILKEVAVVLEFHYQISAVCSITALTEGIREGSGAILIRLLSQNYIVEGIFQAWLDFSSGKLFCALFSYLQRLANLLAYFKGQF